MIDANFTVLLVLTLAAFRLATLVAEDTIFEPVRRWLCKGTRPRTPKNWACNLFTCPFCFGVWMSFLVVGLYGWVTRWPGFVEYVVTSLAVAGGQVLMTSLFHRLEGKVSTKVEQV